MSPPDYDLFPKLKEPLRGIRYDDLNELYRAVNAVVGDINKCCLATGVKELPRRWESTIESAGLRECKHKNVSTFDHILEIKQLSV